jgi:hypothetical protein
MFWESLALDGAVVLVGLCYIFGGRSALHMTISKGILVLSVSLWVALMASQVIRRNSAPLVCYLRWPLDRRVALAIFYLVFVLPPLIIFALTFWLGTSVVMRANQVWNETLLMQRFLQAALAIGFIKSLTVNLMMAISIHCALIALYFVVLGGILLALLILQEVVAPVLILDAAAVSALFLMASYAISFAAIGKLRL